MTKIAFLVSLHNRLVGLPRDEAEERLRFYSEMIEDRMEEGFTEEDAVAAVGSVDEIAAQIVADTPHSTKDTVKPKRRLRAWEIILLVLGSPLWLPLLIAAVAVALALYAVLWSVIVSLWAVFATLIGGTVGGVIGGVGLVLGGNSLSGVALIGAGIVCTGLGIFMYFGCRAATKGVVLLTQSIVMCVKRKLVREEGAQ